MIEKLTMTEHRGDRMTIEIPAQSGSIVSLAVGDRLRVIDVEGTQVADMFAASAEDSSEWLSTSVTRACIWGLFPSVGQSFFSTAYRPLLTLERDDSPGIHDMLIAPCSPAMYLALDHDGYHPSCSENFRKSASQVGWNPAQVPDPVNFFQHTEFDVNGVFTMHPAPTAPGNSVTLRAEAPLHVIVTACSMDLEPINGDHCTSLRLELNP